MRIAEQLQILQRQADDLSQAVRRLRAQLDDELSRAPEIDREGHPSPSVQPGRYMLIPSFATLTGYTEKAIRRKIQEGYWIEGRHYRKSPDGRIHMDLQAYYRWIEGDVR